MQLKDRIKTVMDKEKLSAAMFADIVGVQRSSISHILSGRNKPSLEFLQKVLSAYPKYSVEWLVMGKGIPVNTPSSNTKTNTEIIEQPNLFTNVNTEMLVQERNTEKTDKKVEIEPEKVYENTEKEENKQQKNTKKVEQIIVCYTDKTFDTYAPTE